MYNKDVLNVLIQEFGFEQAIIYCKLEARKNELMLTRSKEIGEIGSSEWEHERDWWNEQLLTLKQDKNESVRTFRKSPKNSVGDKTVVLRKNA